MAECARLGVRLVLGHVVEPGELAALHRTVDHVVVEHGTLPDAGLYEALRRRSRDHGEIGIDDLLAVREQSPVRNPSSGFRLYRIGDAVSGRGIHAAVLDAYRLCVAI